MFETQMKSCVCKFKLNLTVMSFVRAKFRSLIMNTVWDRLGKCISSSSWEKLLECSSRLSVGGHAQCNKTKIRSQTLCLLCKSKVYLVVQEQSVPP